MRRGLTVALHELGLSLRNLAPIGDAQNAQRDADRVSRYDNSRAVKELVDDLTGHDLRAMANTALGAGEALGGPRRAFHFRNAASERGASSRRRV